MDETGNAGETQQPSEQPAPADNAPRISRRSLRRAGFIALGGMALAAVLWTALKIEERNAASQRAVVDEMRNSMRQLSRDLEIARTRAEQARRPAPEPDSYYTLLAAGNLDLRAGRTTAAVTAFRTAIKADARGQLADEAHFRLAECHLKLGAPDDALAEFLLVISGYPGSPFYPKALSESSRLLMKKKDYAQARRLLYQLLGCRGRLSPEDSAALTQAYFRVGECYEAEAASIKSQSAPAGVALGLTARANGGKP